MSGFRIPQVNFTKGEIAPALYARFDVDTWRSALKKARNVIVLKYGGVEKRAGTRLVAEVMDPSQPTRLIPFEFSNEQTYALEFGQAYMTPVAEGGRVLDEELNVTDIAGGATTTVTALFHGFTVGDFVYFENVLGEMGDALNGRFWEVVSVADADNFTIAADTTGLTFTGSTGGTTRVGAPTPAPTPTVPPPVTAPTSPEVSPSGGTTYNPQGQIP